MRRIVASVLMVGCVTTPAVASQAGTGGAATGTPAVRACPVLTRDLVEPFAENKKMLDLIPPNEEPLGTSGAACTFGGVRLQLFPIPSANQKRAPSVKDLQPVSGVGELAFFRNNRDQYTELMVYTATHYFTLQFRVPMGRTGDAMKADTIALANRIIAKLR